jgi:hypothetical protein
MSKDPTIALRDCLAEIAILHEIEARSTLQAFRNDRSFVVRLLSRQPYPP